MKSKQLSKKIHKNKRKNWSKKARGKGYRLENDCVNDLKAQGFYALRIPTMLQVNELSKVDVIFFKGEHGGFIQCKYQRKYFSKKDELKIDETAKKYSSHSELCYRDKGPKYELVPILRGKKQTNIVISNRNSTY